MKTSEARVVAGPSDLSDKIGRYRIVDRAEAELEPDGVSFVSNGQPMPRATHKLADLQRRTGPGAR